MVNFEKIHADNYDRVMSWVMFKVSNREDAEEIVQDVFMKVYNNLSKYDSDQSAISTWIMNITKNTIIDYWRTTKEKMKSLSDFETDDGNELIVHTDGLTPEHTVQNNELGDAINTAINSLPQAYKTISDLFLLKELSHQEIADTLSIPIGTVKASISRAKELLRKRLTNF
jgi:RNA polymerase sigma-70 factor (ECF subfamily)